jgi:hypothetical protein
MRYTRLGWVVVIALTASCSRKSDLIPVTGTVKVDGQPAEGVQVSFWPAEGSDSRDRYGAATTGRDGRFELKSISERGIESGGYKVTFSRMVAGGKVVTDPKKKGGNVKESLPERYTAQESTDITAQVSRDNHDFVFEISSKPK